MTGVDNRMKEFLRNWPKVKEQREEVLRDDERSFHSDGVSRSLPGESKDDLPETLG